MAESKTRIEIGIGGDLAGLRGREAGGTSHDPLRQYRVWEGDFAAQFADLKERVAAYDLAASIPFIEVRPPQERAEEFGDVALAAGMPLRQFTDVYTIGGSHTAPDALETLRANLALARRVGTVERLNMQVVGNDDTPTIDELYAFYDQAEELAQAAGIVLFTETHVDRFTYDPRRLIAVHEVLRDRSGGRLGLRVGADLSHYIHQLGNSHFANAPAIASGDLPLDPRNPDNIVSQRIIQTGMIGYGHLRMAVPNDLPRGAGSIQYPVVDPKSDPETAHLPNGGMREPWDESRTIPWWIWYREIFACLLQQPDGVVVRFSTEFIGDVAPGEYRVEPYRNLFQNIAMLAAAQRVIRELQG